MYTFHLHWLQLAPSRWLMRFWHCLHDVCTHILQFCVYFIFTNVHRMKMLVLFWTKPILHRCPHCSCGATVHFPCKPYQAVQFYQSASVSGCSNGMHMFWISCHLALKSLRLLAGLVSLVGPIAQQWPPGLLVVLQLWLCIPQLRKDVEKHDKSEG